MGIIYIITSPDGKNYIGQTTRAFAVRLNGHKSAAGNLTKKDGCRCLNNAIRKHGWDEFTKDIILECDNDELNFYEAYFIKEYDSLAPNGYNLTLGGDSNKEYSEQTIQKMRESALLRDSSRYRKKEATTNYPKYLGLYCGYPRITKHPNCSCKPFNDKTKTFDENLIEALSFLDKLNNNEVVVVIEKSNRPKGLQLTKGGYRVHYINKSNVKITKLFTNQNVDQEVKYNSAIEYLQDLIHNDK